MRYNYNSIYQVSLPFPTEIPRVRQRIVPRKVLVPGRIDITSSEKWSALRYRNGLELAWLSNIDYPLKKWKLLQEPCTV